MPSKSKKQARFMAAAAHDPAFAKKAGIPQSVAQEFNEADQATRNYSGPGRKGHGAKRATGKTRSYVGH